MKIIDVNTSYIIVGDYMETRKSRKKIKDVFEMLEDPDRSGYIGEELDEMDLYDQELEEQEKLEEEEMDEDDSDEEH